jgi:RNA polymerase sigma-70 factor, ECF subfamily
MESTNASALYELRAAEPNELVQRALLGCADAFSELATRFYPRLVHLVQPRIFGGSHMDAEDIAQEALSRAFQNLPQFDASYRFSTWLYTIAFRIATDHNRGRRRRLNLAENHRSLVNVSIQSSLESSFQFEQREAVDSIWQVARQVLGDLQYTAVWLRFGEELSVGEIATIMRKTNVGVRVLLHRARAKLIKGLDQEAARSSSQPMSKSD